MPASLRGKTVTYKKKRLTFPINNIIHNAIRAQSSNIYWFTKSYFRIRVFSQHFSHFVDSHMNIVTVNFWLDQVQSHNILVKRMMS